MFELIPLKKLGWPVNELALDWMDRFFDRFHSMNVDGVWNPSFDVSETDEHFLVKADLPGIDIKDLDISIDNGVLTVRGVKRDEKKKKGENFHRTERSFGSFCRSFWGARRRMACTTGRSSSQ